VAPIELKHLLRDLLRRDGETAKDTADFAGVVVHKFIDRLHLVDSDGSPHVSLNQPYSDWICTFANQDVRAIAGARVSFLSQSSSESSQSPIDALRTFATVWLIGLKVDGMHAAHGVRTNAAVSGRVDFPKNVCFRPRPVVIRHFELRLEQSLEQSLETL
jgi:hypothetical protein